MAVEGPSSAAAILSSVLENIKNLPNSSSSHSSTSLSRPAASVRGGPRFDAARLFGRQRPVHDLLGGGTSADVMLWRNKNLSVGLLSVATTIWMVFEWIGYHFVSVVSLFLLLATVILFAWSYGASMLNRDPPPVPKFELSDEVVLKAAKSANFEINKMLNILYNIATGKDVLQFVKLAGVLGLLVLFGSCFHFLTLIYLAIVAAHVLPILYEKNEDWIDRYVQIALDELGNQLNRVDTSMFSKIPRGTASQKRKD